MMVHRVGNTLLLEDFDIHKHLLRCQQDDWAWLRNFYYDNIVRQMHVSCVFCNLDHQTCWIQGFILTEPFL